MWTINWGDVGAWTDASCGSACEASPIVEALSVSESQCFPSEWPQKKHAAVQSSGKSQPILILISSAQPQSIFNKHVYSMKEEKTHNIVSLGTGWVAIISCIICIGLMVCPPPRCPKVGNLQSQPAPGPLASFAWDPGPMDPMVSWCLLGWALASNSNNTHWDLQPNRAIHWWWFDHQHLGFHWNFMGFHSCG